MLAFVHIEKCGGTTLIGLLRSAFFLDHFDVIPRDPRAMRFTSDDLRRLKRLRPSVKSLAGHSVRYDAGLHEAFPVQYFTLLRDPIKRYLSDYEHLGKGFLLADHAHEGDCCFERWLDLEPRRDYQTKAIASAANADAASRLLAKRFAVVGLIEAYDRFLAELRGLVDREYGVALPTAMPAKNVRSHQAHVRDEQARLLDRYGDQIAAANAQDLLLYRNVEARLAAQPAPSETPAVTPEPHPLRAKTAAGVSWLYRNAVYKPHAGRWPFVPHALPVYRGEPSSEPASRAA